jgi:pyrroloquinoline-quinone synthase
MDIGMTMGMPTDHAQQPWGDYTTSSSDQAPLPPEAFVAALRAQARRYHHVHPFHLAMHAGRLTRSQLQTWVANRYYYQQSIPLKDAAILSNCPDAAIRRRWLVRLFDQDGTADGEGGLEAWLRLAEAVGLCREEVLRAEQVVPGVRFAADAYVTFARIRPWIEAVAASLTELFAPSLMRERIAAFERHYSWIAPEGLGYFRSRLVQAPRDATQALELVTQYCVTGEQQARALAALVFKTDVLWSLLDAIAQACGVQTCGVQTWSGELSDAG